MSPAEIAAIVKLRLAAQLADDRVSLERLSSAVASLLVPADSERGEWMRVLALAFEVERYDTAVETVLTRVLRTIDGEVPSGGAWHLEVLRAASVAIAGGRPALLSHETASELRELLKFRHLARHGYDEEPELARMEEHARRVARAHEGFAASLNELDRWLRAS